MCKFLYIFLVLFSLSAVAADKKPNILFILTDDQRFDNLSCYGNPLFKTPNIDKLADQGTRFTEMFVTTSICATSRS
ncbi:MAG: sulfatase-like hydrolase/transferase, partial [Lentisphaeraceae bacterium]|nr:sulfatase-like hydrolase/transferase [Lentisphaeraceae bacterium]